MVKYYPRGILNSEMSLTELNISSRRRCSYFLLVILAHRFENKYFAQHRFSKFFLARMNISILKLHFEEGKPVNCSET